MTVKFYKYQGTGNDFIMIDNRAYGLTKQRALIEKLCNRHMGVGADGLIYLQQRTGYDFEMVYFNSDGNESTMCGNGGRCLIRFAQQLNVIQQKCFFLAIDGGHEGEILQDGRISLKMKDVDTIERLNNDYVLNTGSPHYVKITTDVGTLAVVEAAREIRYSERFKAEGINVNFVEPKAGELFVRTYERGVEDETLSCGTGVVASALVFAGAQDGEVDRVRVNAIGGNLEVKFTRHGNGFKDIYLIGPAVKVFEGTIEI
ncbi:MAG: diaminopimelate epimerase [Chitinophagales bacterium]